MKITIEITEEEASWAKYWFAHNKHDMTGFNNALVCRIGKALQEKEKGNGLLAIRYLPVFDIRDWIHRWVF